MKPIEVARLLNLGDSTVRKWADEFKDFLSPTAVGGNGQWRDFSERDIRIMALLKQRTEHSVGRPKIIAELKQLRDNNWFELPNLDKGDDGLPPESPLLNLAIERKNLIQKVEFMETQVTELKAELDDERGGFSS